MEALAETDNQNTRNTSLLQYIWIISENKGFLFLLSSANVLTAFIHISPSIVPWSSLVYHQPSTHPTHSGRSSVLNLFRLGVYSNKLVSRHDLTGSNVMVHMKSTSDMAMIVVFRLKFYLVNSENFSHLLHGDSSCQVLIPVLKIH